MDASRTSCFCCFSASARDGTWIQREQGVAEAALGGCFRFFTPLVRHLGPRHLINQITQSAHCGGSRAPQSARGLVVSSDLFKFSSCCRHKTGNGCETDVGPVRELRGEVAVTEQATSPRL